MRSKMGKFVLIGLMFALSPMAANAAFITIDDSDVDTITITAGDFEGCFFVNSVQLGGCGLYFPGSITLPDGQLHDFSGSWIDLGETPSIGLTQLWFGIGAEILSGIEFYASTDGYYGTTTAVFTGFDPSRSYGLGSSVNPQDGSARDFSQPFSKNTFISEAARIPEPGALALFGIGLAGIGLFRRKKKA